MHIHEIIIDGFKSYATRTVVSGFDPQFNAITGLNGSGKSNILDSICFVLGISNLSQVRVGNLQELVYKQGQAGVTKASVTIVFNNPDPATGPLGYEAHKQITVTRQVVIGGKNKYLINGRTSDQSQVQNLFHSVQLNVNNPHFLIMQGRITKVLNMKPPEILSMIEEAAGTRMFETKKQTALKTIEKKQQKVEEITRVMDDDISPKLSQLRKDKQSFLEWSSNITEVEKLERFCLAAEYKQAAVKVQESENGKTSLENKLEELNKMQEQYAIEAKSCDHEIEVLTNRKHNDMDTALDKLKKSEQELSKELVKINSVCNNQKETLHSENESLLSLSKQIDGANANLNEKQEELVQCNVELERKESQVAAVENNAQVLRTKYQNACAGVTDEDDAQLLSLPEQIGSWEKKAREAQSKLQQETMKIEHSKNRLKELQKALKNEQNTHSRELREAENIRSVLNDITKKAEKLSVSEEEESTLRSTKGSLDLQLQELNDRIENLSAQLEARLNFEFRDPERGFNRARVKGVVAKLVRVPDPVHATALEVAAGGKLFQVVVDNEQTGAMLLKNGDLKKRVTLLPLNKINNKCLDNNKIEKSKRVAHQAGGFANLALELVGYDEEVKRAMQYTFGNAIICSNSAIAQAITFNNEIRCKTVTLEGDSFDPSGTVTGGSRNSIGVLLTKLCELSTMQERYDSLSAELTTIEKQLRKIENNSSELRELRSAQELKLHALAICEEKLANSTYSQMANEISELETEIKRFDEDIVIPLTASHKKATEELKKLENAAANIKSQRETAMKQMEKSAKDAQKQLTSVKSEAAVIKTKRDKINAEIEAIQNDIKSLTEQKAACEKGIAKLTLECTRADEQVVECKSKYENAKSQLTQMQNTIQQFSKDIKQLTNTRDTHLKNAQNASLESRKILHELNTWKKETKDAEKKLSDMIKKYPWIESEKQFFGLEGSDYDFNAMDMKSCVSKLNDLKSSQDKLSKSVNKKVMGTIDKVESEHSELRRKKEVILNDKAKIETVIQELDVKKVQALQTTWVKVNRDFGSIFSTLLPGTHAKLEIPDGCTLMDGLEVKVAFNGVWKESLTELSGGQRSLLALSLILSLLLFKPAPMYILDEVDAALDLSHTQNIGLMLKNHFSSSQFIVVSLKEGMFNNANVIFRTRFVDGISAVTRTVVNGAKNKVLTNHSSNVIDGDDEVEKATDSPIKKKGKKSKKTGKDINPSVDIENVSLQI